MTTDEFIEAAIEAGGREGVESLEPAGRLAFLISEAEVLCDMEGIDSFLDRYAPSWLPETASAFEAVGASEIASHFRTIAIYPPADENVLSMLNDLIRGRIGYDYESIRMAVESRLT